VFSDPNFLQIFFRLKKIQQKKKLAREKAELARKKRGEEGEAQITMLFE